MGTQFSLRRRGIFPQFSAHVYCGQAARWIRIPLGTEVGLGPGDCVRWGPSSASEKRVQPLSFWPMYIVAKRWLDEDATWYGNRPRLRPHCVRRGPSSTARKGLSSPPLFGPCLLWPSPISATAELWYCHSRLGSENKNAAEFCICLRFGRT